MGERVYVWVLAPTWKQRVGRALCRVFGHDKRAGDYCRRCGAFYLPKGGTLTPDERRQMMEFAGLAEEFVNIFADAWKGVGNG